MTSPQSQNTNIGGSVLDVPVAVERVASNSHNPDASSTASDTNKFANADPTLETALLRKELDLIEVDHDRSWLIVSNRPAWLNAVALFVLTGCGVFEGYVMNRVGLSDPTAITQQFTFHTWIVLIVFVSAVAASMLVGGVLDFVVPSLYERTRSGRKDRAGYVRTVIGGCGVGIGLAICGSGPTILPTQLAAGTGTAWATLVGMLAGALCYSIFDHFYGEGISCPLRLADKTNLDDRLEIRFCYIGIPVGVLVFGGVAALNLAYLTPERDSPKLQLGPSWGTSKAWPAIVLGACIGGLQIVYRVLGQRGQGGATSFMSVISTLTCGKLAPKQLLWDSEKGGLKIGMLWQPAFVFIGTSLGSLAARETGSPIPPGLTYWRAVVGGFVVLFSARISNSCTCGGITLAGESNLEGLLMVTCVFIMAVVMEWILVAAGAQGGW